MPCYFYFFHYRSSSNDATGKVGIGPQEWYELLTAYLALSHSVASMSRRAVFIMLVDPPSLCYIFPADSGQEHSKLLAALRFLSRIGWPDNILLCGFRA